MGCNLSNYLTKGKRHMANFCSYGNEPNSFTASYIIRYVRNTLMTVSKTDKNKVSFVYKMSIIKLLNLMLMFFLVIFNVNVNFSPYFFVVFRVYTLLSVQSFSTAIHICPCRAHSTVSLCRRTRFTVCIRRTCLAIICCNRKLFSF